MQMKLFFSPNSPYVRKCLVAADELGLADLIELLPGSPHPVARDQSIVIKNPLGKIPTLITKDGQSFYDSRVICEYLNSVGQGSLIPIENGLRWYVLTLQSLGDGILDAALLIRYETNVRPDRLRWPDWINGKLDAIHTSLTYLDQHPKVFDQDFHLGLLTVGCALWYLDLRYPELEWRKKYPQLAKASEPVLFRPSMQRTWTMPV